MRKVAVILTLVAAPLAFGASLPIFVPMDQQIDIGLGPAITCDEFTEGGSRMYLEQGYNFSIILDLTLAGLGPVDLSGAGLQLSFDGRIYQDPNTNTDPYGDAPIFCYLKDANGKNYGLGMMYQTSLGDPPYPTWTGKTADLDFSIPGQWPYDPDFDPTQVVKVLWYSTDWFTTITDPPGDDFMDISNLNITPEPASLALLVLGALLRRR